MNRITRKLVLSILTVVLTVVALGTTTFAWFTLGNVVKLDQFEADIISDEGIEISLDGKNWYNNITPEMITTYLGTTNFEALNHVTSADGKTFKQINDDNTGLDGPASDKGYIEIKLYFRSAVANDIYWTDFDLEGSKVPWTADVEFTHSDDITYGPDVVGKETVDVDPANAARISVVGGDATGTVKVVERFEATHGNTVLNTGGAAAFADKGQASYYEAKTQQAPFGQDSVTTIATSSLGNGVKVLTLDDDYEMPEGSVTKEGDFLGHVTIFIWIEGYDNEAYNSILGETIKVALEFRTTEK